LSGNVDEWCLIGLVRGGNWGGDYRKCVVTNRDSLKPQHSFRSGLRVALTT